MQTVIPRVLNNCHVYRMERERKPKQFMEAQVEGRKQREYKE
jgi:hypothetical protein